MALAGVAELAGGQSNLPPIHCSGSTGPTRGCKFVDTPGHPVAAKVLVNSQKGCGRIHTSEGELECKIREPGISSRTHALGSPTSISWYSGAGGVPGGGTTGGWASCV
jgi:hypothetical protein